MHAVESELTHLVRPFGRVSNIYPCSHFISILDSRPQEPNREAISTFLAFVEEILTRIRSSR